MKKTKAIQFTGNNRAEVLKFCRPKLSKTALEGARVMSLPVYVPTCVKVNIMPGQWVTANVDHPGMFNVVDVDPNL